MRRLRLALILLFVALSASVTRPSAQIKPLPPNDVANRFTSSIRPFLDTYCIACHGGQAPAAQFDLRAYSSPAEVVRDHPRWTTVREKLAANQMPPPQAKQPSDEARQQVIAWIDAVREEEARKNAGDPGVVLPRRLSNAEYNYTIRDLTGVDLQPAREFPVDPANPAGFDNSGESLVMSPQLLTKYLQAAQLVANHLVLKPSGLTFASHPMLVETDRDKYCVNQIIEFYRQHSTDYADYFDAAWRYKHRAALGWPKATLSDFAGLRARAPGKSHGPATVAAISAKYLATIWRALEGTKEDVGPLAKLQRMWRALPGPIGLASPKLASGTERAPAGVIAMRDYVVQLRKRIEVKHTELNVKGIGEDAQPFLMWRNQQYAINRRNFDRAALVADGEIASVDRDLQVPAGQRERYEAAFARFASIFPDAFYVSERGRYFPDSTRDVGRHLSAGFHNLMGYFRDDRPFYELILNDLEQQQLDAMWQELDFIASATSRTYIQFYLSESGEARKAAAAAVAGRADDNADVASAPMIQKVANAYLERAKPAGNAVAMKAIEDHFAATNAAIRWVEKARLDAEPKHLAALEEFAARAYRRPLTQAEREGLLSYYRSLRDKSGLTHEDAIRDSVVSVLMSPDFCYRLDLVDASSLRTRNSTPRTRNSARGTPHSALRTKHSELSDYALASRLSYFLWSSMPDETLLARAAARELHRPEVLAAETRRMLKDNRVRGLATEFGGNWLDFRRFDQHNAVDRERFTIFTNELRQAMFEEPLQFMLDVFRENRSVLDFLYANHTFVNPLLARHYGVPAPAVSQDQWVRVDTAQYGRGGLLPMAVFLTKNAPGLRTSPVKRGYWVVKQVLGEQIPPPPAVVPELPRDEAKLDLPLRELLARHREDKSCSVCHARFDALGLVFEGYGPVGERRTADLSGRPVDASATFPDGRTGTGLDGLRAYVRQHRQDDFIENLCRKLLAYALNRSLILSDDPTIDAMQAKLAKSGHRFDSLIESVVTSTQFRHKRVVPPQQEQYASDFSAPR